jgi:hypothetical protein
MKLDTISLDKTSPLTSPKTFGLNGLKPLSIAEESMIQEKFPTGSNRRLELYMSSGLQRTEMPDAKGRHFDFTI